MFEDNSIYDNIFDNLDEIYDSLSNIIRETEENEIKITSIIIKPINNTFYTEIYFNKSENGINLYNFIRAIFLVIVFLKPLSFFFLTRLFLVPPFSLFHCLLHRPQ